MIYQKSRRENWLTARKGSKSLNKSRKNNKGNSQLEKDPRTGTLCIYVTLKDKKFPQRRPSISIPISISGAYFLATNKKCNNMRCRK